MELIRPEKSKKMSTQKMYIVVTLSGHIQHSNSKYMDTSSVVNPETADPYLIIRPLGPEILNFGSVRFWIRNLTIYQRFEDLKKFKKKFNI
jgi:hypothetical protein